MKVPTSASAQILKALPSAGETASLASPQRQPSLKRAVFLAHPPRQCCNVTDLVYFLPLQLGAYRLNNRRLSSECRELYLAQLPHNYQV